jgi:hypothetical protein
MVVHANAGKETEPKEIRIEIARAKWAWKTQPLDVEWAPWMLKVSIRWSAFYVSVGVAGIVASVFTTGLMAAAVSTLFFIMSTGVGVMAYSRTYQRVKSIDEWRWIRIGR